MFRVGWVVPFDLSLTILSLQNVLPTSTAFPDTQSESKILFFFVKEINCHFDVLLLALVIPLVNQQILYLKIIPISLNSDYSFGKLELVLAFWIWILACLLRLNRNLPRYYR